MNVTFPQVFFGSDLHGVSIKRNGSNLGQNKIKFVSRSARAFNFFCHKLPYLHFFFDFFKNQNQTAYFEVKLAKLFMKNWNCFPEICVLVWITINSSPFEQWNISTWASHLKYWQITFKFHESLKNKKTKKTPFAFVLWPAMGNKVVFYFGLILGLPYLVSSPRCFYN